ncbi:MAG: hypothetical protein ACBR15_15430 [Microcoleus sp.]
MSILSFFNNEFIDIFDTRLPRSFWVSDYRVMEPEPIATIYPFGKVAEWELLALFLINQRLGVFWR